MSFPAFARRTPVDGISVPLCHCATLCTVQIGVMTVGQQAHNLGSITTVDAVGMSRRCNVLPSHAVDAVLYVDGCDASALRILGYTRRELVGQNVACIVPEPMSSFHQAKLNKFIRSAREVRIACLLNIRAIAA